MSALANRIKGWWQTVVTAVKPKAAAVLPFKGDGSPTEQEDLPARRKPHRKARK